MNKAKGRWETIQQKNSQYNLLAKTAALKTKPTYKEQGLNNLDIYVTFLTNCGSEMSSQ